MRKQFALCAVAVATVLAVLPAGTAMAQPRSRGQSPAQTAAAQRRLSLGAVHLVTGTVRNTAGHAVSGACVVAAGPTGQVKIARTGADGWYELALPRTGAYTLRYRNCAPGIAPTPAAPDRQVVIGASPITSLPATILERPDSASRPTALAAAGVVMAGHRRIMLAQPGEVIVNGQSTRPAAGSVGLAVVTGKVTSPAGRPLAGICMWIVGKGFAAGTATNKHGTYRFEVGGPGFPYGKYPVEFDSFCTGANPFPPPIAPGPWAPEWYKDKFSAAKANKVLVKVGKTTRGINAVMRPGGEVSGTISGSDHRRLKNACAFVTDPAGQETGQAVTNAKGHYTVTGLDPGSYRVIAVPACTGGASDYGQAWYPKAASLKSARAVKVRLGHVTGGINVVVPKLGIVTGVIRLGGKTGKPLGGMCVDVYSPTNFNLDFSANSRSNGRFTIEGVPAGRYQAEANPGCNNNGNYAYASYPGTVRVSDGKTTSGINMYLQPGGTLTGTVTDAATAAPLAGVCVTDDDGDVATTGADGRYTIDQLPAERTSVTFIGGCGNTGSYAPQYWNDQASQEAAGTVVVKAGHVTAGINAAMQPGATISGKTTRASGQAVGQVCVSALPIDFAGTAYSQVGANVTTTATGAYTIANLAPGPYAIVFWSGCEGISTYAAAQQWFKGQPTEDSAGLVSAPAGQPVAGINAVLTRSGAIAGTVTDATGQPVDFGCVAAVNQTSGLAGGDITFSFSGQYEITGLAPGRYTVLASSCFGGSDAGATHLGVVTVRAGHTTRNVNLRLARGASITGKLTVTGTGAPAKNVCVDASPATSSLAKQELFGSEGVTNAAGKYRIGGLASGRYWIEVFTNCLGPASNLASVNLRHTVWVSAGKVKPNVNVVLRPGGSIAGQVSGPGAQPEPGQCVEIDSLSGGPGALGVTGAGGKYTLGGLAVGRYKVEFGDAFCSDGAAGLGVQWYNGAPGPGSAALVDVRADHTTGSIDAALPADGTITGSVTGTGAAPLTGVCVSAVPVAGGEPATFTVTAGGTYSLAGIRPGKYRVEFQAGCGKSGVKTQWWDAAASGATAMAITVGAGATVSGIDAVMTGG